MDTATQYRIVVEGELDETWAEWLGGMKVTTTQYPTSHTIITGPIADQSALRGLLTRLWDLNLILLSLHRVEPEESVKNNFPKTQA